MILSLLTVASLAVTAPAQQPIDTELVASLNAPVFVCAAPGDDASRIFIVTQFGRIRIVKNGVLLPTPYLDINSKLTFSGERGLLGMAFHPDYEQNGYFFVNYSDNTGGDTVIERYQVDPNDADLAMPASAFTIIEIDQPYSNHNGGWTEFGPDGYLYVAMGDGGSGGDPGNRAQSGSSLLGKMLRLDVDNPAGGLNYGIPPSNPFVGDPNFLDEIWSYGLRNPWRCDFDPLTDDLWIADVGQSAWEEINFEPAGQGGRNYGWRIMEGNHCYNPSSGCNMNGLVLPIYEYSHSSGRCSVTGGVLFRGRSMANMHGRYFFSDYCGGQTYSIRQVGGVQTDFTDHTADLNGIGSIIGWGEDADAEAYVCSTNAVYRVVPSGLRLRLPHLTAGSATTATVTGGALNSTCGIFFSPTGLGATTVPAAGVTLDLASARLIATSTTDGAGSAAFSGTIPANLQDRTIWVQAAQLGSKSNVFIETVD
ncbi:MAG: PQQ-dependent sugar dehydrogenase [Planctomycetota bacterium]|nr:PQQ-dependent sugar dehydrogenase [Planctomycetota bacterium]